VLACSLIALGGWSSAAHFLLPASAQTAVGRPPVPQDETNGTPPERKVLSKDGRLAFIRRGQVWTPTDIPHMNLRAGPDGPWALQPNEHVTCIYAEVPKHGNTRKFHCTLPGGEVVKVRYGAHNGEVQASLLSTRLLWALGFQADRVYSGHVMHDANGKPHGWSWSELDLVDPNAGGAPVEQRDALKLLAAFIQHGDSKREQQRLLCVNGFSDNGDCAEPFLMLHDVGVTFGRSNTINSNSTGSVNFEAWSTTPVWRNSAACVAELSKSHTGTLGDPRIGDVGRQFLSNLLAQLSDRQIRDLFEVAGVERRADSSGRPSGVPVDNWVAAFESKRDQIVRNHCGASTT
jgi:hypothetical protein